MRVFAHFWFGKKLCRGRRRVECNLLCKCCNEIRRRSHLSDPGIIWPFSALALPKLYCKLCFLCYETSFGSTTFVIQRLFVISGVGVSFPSFGPQSVRKSQCRNVTRTSVVAIAANTDRQKTCRLVMLCPVSDIRGTFRFRACG